MVTVARITLDPAQIVPPIVDSLFPGIVPIHAITIVDAITEDGSRALFSLVDSAQPDWVTIGMLDLLKSDVTALWTADTVYATAEDDEDDEDEEDEYEDE
jgi:hypothetical protein